MANRSSKVKYIQSGEGYMVVHVMCNKCRSIPNRFRMTDGKMYCGNCGFPLTVNPTIESTFSTVSDMMTAFASKSLFALKDRKEEDPEIRDLNRIIGEKDQTIDSLNLKFNQAESRVSVLEKQCNELSSALQNKESAMREMENNYVLEIEQLRTGTSTLEEKLKNTDSALNHLENERNDLEATNNHIRSEL